VAIGVVDPLEQVDVQQHQAMGFAHTGGRLEHSVELLVEALSIENPCQRIGQGLVHDAGQLGRKTVDFQSALGDFAGEFTRTVAHVAGALQNALQQRLCRHRRAVPDVAHQLIELPLVNTRLLPGSVSRALDTADHPLQLLADLLQRQRIGLKQMLLV